MERVVLVLVAVGLLAYVGSPTPGRAFERPSGVGMRETAAGTVMTDAEGMTLYTLELDPIGVSVCLSTTNCPKQWRPLGAPDDAASVGEFSIITRDDGSKQWAWRGKPLYTFFMDQQPGDTKGDRYGDVGRAAKR